MSQAESYANAHGIRVTFKGNSGYVVSQSLPANKRIDLINGTVVLTLSGESKPSSTPPANEGSGDKLPNNPPGGGSGTGGGSGSEGSEGSDGGTDGSDGGTGGEDGSGGSGNEGNEDGKPGDPTE